MGSNCAPKCSVNSVRSVRDKTPQRVSQLFFFSQSTQMNRTHKVQKDDGPSPVPSWPLPRPLPKREGRDHRDTPITRVYASVYPRIGSPIGVTSHTTPLPTGEGPGEGPAVVVCWASCGCVLATILCVATPTSPYTLQAHNRG